MLRLATLLSILLLSFPARTQPSAADTALVDAVVAAIDVGAFPNARVWPPAQPVDGLLASVFDGPTVRDGLRHRLLMDVRPALLREALAHLEGLAHRTLVNHARWRTAELSTPQSGQAGAPPNGAPSADSTLVQRLAESQRLATHLPAVFRQAADRVAAVGSPEATRSAAALRRSAAAGDAHLGPALVEEARAVLAGAPDGTVLDAVRYYESPAGRYVYDAEADALREAMAAALSERMTRSFEGAGSASPPPPPSPGPDGIFDAPDTMPELIDGVDGLNARAARHEGVRGRGLGGAVIVQFVVDVDGTVMGASVLRSPDPALSEAALDAVRDSRFVPGSFGGEPVQVRTFVSVTFRPH